MTASKRASVVLSARPIVAIPSVVFGVALLTSDGELRQLAATAILIDVAVKFVPWRVPRADRTGTSYWIEAVSYLAALVIFTGAAYGYDASFVEAVAHPLWFLVGAALGIVLIALARIPLDALFRGDAAFLIGADRPSHAYARVTASLTAPLPEEALFRGIVLGSPPLVAILSACAFVTRHHLVRGVRLWSAPQLIVEISAAVSLTALALLSGSIYPGVLAHTISNVPMAVIDIGRARLNRRPQL